MGAFQVAGSPGSRFWASGLEDVCGLGFTVSSLGTFCKCSGLSVFCKPFVWILGPYPEPCTSQNGSQDSMQRRDLCLRDAELHMKQLRSQRLQCSSFFGGHDLFLLRDCNIAIPKGTTFEPLGIGIGARTGGGRGVTALNRLGIPGLGFGLLTIAAQRVQVSNI